MYSDLVRHNIESYLSTSSFHGSSDFIARVPVDVPGIYEAAAHHREVMCSRTRTNYPRCGCVHSTKTEKCSSGIKKTCRPVSEIEATSEDICPTCLKAVKRAVQSMADKRGMVHM